MKLHNFKEESFYFTPMGNAPPRSSPGKNRTKRTNKLKLKLKQRRSRFTFTTLSNPVVLSSKGLEYWKLEEEKGDCDCSSSGSSSSSSSSSISSNKNTSEKSNSKDNTVKYNQVQVSNLFEIDNNMNEGSEHRQDMVEKQRQSSCKKEEDIRGCNHLITSQEGQKGNNTIKFVFIFLLKFETYSKHIPPNCAIVTFDCHR